MQFKVTADTQQVKRFLSSAQKRQIPFAMAGAINDTAFAAQKELSKQTAKKFDRPTKFTQKAFAVKKATKRNLTGLVFVKAIQERYLKHQIFGGERKAKLVSVPVGVKLNAFGNIPGLRRKKAQWLQGIPTGKDMFVGVINGRDGLWQRIGRDRVKLIVAFEKEATYKKRFPMEKIVGGIIKSKFQKNFNRRLTQALRTAR